MSHTIPTPTAADVRTGVIRALGFTPEESVVLLPTGTSGGIARVDLAPLKANPGHEILTRIIDALANAHVHEVTVVYFTQTDPLTLADVDGELTSLLLNNHIGRAQTVLIDEPPTGPRHADLAVITPAHNAAQARAARAFTTATPDLAAYLRALDRVRAGRYIPAAMLGDAGKCLTNVHLRDAVVVALTGTILDPTTEGPTEDMAGQALARILDPGTGQRPGLGVTDHEQLLTQIIAHLPTEHHAPARTLLALTTWWRGIGTIASAHLREALTVDPDDRLAQLIAYTFRHAIQPGWATRH